MEIKQIVNVKSGYNETIPLFIDKDESNVRIIHGNKNFIKISELKDNILKEVTSFRLKPLNSIHSILLDDLDNDDNKELLYFDKKNKIRFFRLDKNHFYLLHSQDFSRELKKLSDKEDIEIKLIKKVNKELIVIGTDYGLLFCSIDKNLNMQYKESIKEKNIWECVQSDFLDTNKNYYFIGSEDKILVLNNLRQKILEIETNERIYCIDLYDFDGC